MNKKELLIELIMPVVFGIVGIYVIVQAQGMKSEGVFPTLSAGVLLACVVYLFLETLIKKKKVVQLEGVNLVMVLLTLVILIAYVLLLRRIGYVLDTFLLCAGIIVALGYRKWIPVALCAAATVAGTFLIFKVLLHVPLPMLFLDI